MQRLDILPAKGRPSGCVLDGDHAAVPFIGLLARRGKFQIWTRFGRPEVSGKLEQSACRYRAMNCTATHALT